MLMVKSGVGSLLVGENCMLNDIFFSCFVCLKMFSDFEFSQTGRNVVFIF